MDLYKCKYERCQKYIIKSKSFYGYCFHCHYVFCERNDYGHRKTKELAVLSFLISEFPDFNYVINKRFKIKEGICSPDIVFFLADRFIIVEVDENQHRSYNNDKEERRMNELCDALYNYDRDKVYIIRFNPDEYIIKENDRYKVHRSCWMKKDMKYRVINDIKWNIRLSKLRKVVEECVSEDGQNEVLYLYYDHKISSDGDKYELTKKDYMIYNRIKNKKTPIHNPGIKRKTIAR